MQVAFQIAGEAEVVLEHEYVAEAGIAGPPQNIKMAFETADCPVDQCRISSVARDKRRHSGDAIERRLCCRQFPQDRIVSVNPAIRVDDVDLLYWFPAGVIFGLIMRLDPKTSRNAV